MGGSGPAHTADPALAHRRDVEVLGAGWTLLPGSAQSCKGLNMEISKLSVTAVLPLPPQPLQQSHTPASRKLSQGGTCKARVGRQVFHAQVGTCGIPGRAAPAHAPRYCSVINYLLQPPSKPVSPVLLNSYGAGSSTPGTWVLPFPLTLWHQDLVLLFCTGGLLLPRDCWGILLTPSSSD